MLKADFHIHTCYSIDCSLSLDKVINRCLDTGINCIAVADHGTIAGAVKLKEIAPFPVIIAEEILTPVGEIIGLFLVQEIPSPLPFKEAIAQIKAQGGLVLLPHPFDQFRLSIFNKGSVEELLPFIDIVEVFNARSLFPGSSARAWQLAQQYGLAASAGSDAHTAWEIGKAYVEMEEFNGKEDFLKSLRQGKIIGHRSSLAVHFVSTWTRLKNHLKGKRNC